MSINRRPTSRRRILILWLLVLSGGAAAAAQAPPPQIDQPVKTIKAGAVSFSHYEQLDAVAAAATFYLDGSARTAYYKNFIALTVLLANRDKHLPTPSAIQFKLAAMIYRGGCKYKDNHQLVLATDERPLLSTELRAPQVSVRVAQCLELYEFSMPYEQFIELTNARQAWLGFGDKKLKLKATQLAALRTMTRGIGQY